MTPPHCPACGRPADEYHAETCPIGGIYPAHEEWLDNLARKLAPRLRLLQILTPTYDFDDLRCVLDFLERSFGLDSAAFFAAHLADGPEVRSMPNFTRHTWAGFYNEWLSIQ